MVWFLVRLSILDPKIFFQKYQDLKSNRILAGCTKLIYYEKENNSDIVTIFTEWSSCEAFREFQQNNKDVYQKYYRVEFTEIYELYLIFHDTVDLKYSKSQTHLFQRTMVENPDQFVERFTESYEKYKMLTRGVASVDVFANVNNKSIITLLGRWDNQAASDKWAASDERRQLTNNIQTISEADTYRLSLLDYWVSDTK